MLGVSQCGSSKLMSVPKSGLSVNVTIATSWASLDHHTIQLVPQECGWASVASLLLWSLQA